jgi:hypothetical protein
MLRHRFEARHDYEISNRIYAEVKRKTKKAKRLKKLPIERQALIWWTQMSPERRQSFKLQGAKNIKKIVSLFLKK